MKNPLLDLLRTAIQPDLTAEELSELTDRNQPLEFGHTLADQIGGQLDAGFHLTGFYEDTHRYLEIAKFIPTYAATRALKP